MVSLFSRDLFENGLEPDYISHMRDYRGYGRLVTGNGPFLPDYLEFLISFSGTLGDC
jgi:hypothetical protein